MENKDQLEKASPSLKEFQNLLDQDFKDRKLKENEIIKIRKICHFFSPFIFDLKNSNPKIVIFGHFLGFHFGLIFYL